MTLLLCALCGFTLAEVTKRALQLKTSQNSWAKIAVALGGSALVAGLTFRRDAQGVAIYAVAGLGLAMVVHKFYRAASARGDEVIIDIISKRGRR